MWHLSGPTCQVPAEFYFTNISKIFLFFPQLGPSSISPLLCCSSGFRLPPPAHRNEGEGSRVAGHRSPGARGTVLPWSDLGDSAIPRRGVCTSNARWTCCSPPFPMYTRMPVSHPATENLAALQPQGRAWLRAMQELEPAPLAACSPASESKEVEDSVAVGFGLGTRCVGRRRCRLCVM
jgi:hypothetical protein